MTRLFALADLHLSLTGDKPMDKFGELWRNHAERMAQRWDAKVGDEDTVLLAGDLSWARNLREVAPDLEWIGRRPGRKILLKGNHDSWWTSRRRLGGLLPPDCELLQHDAHLLDGWVVLGARGWTAPDDPISTEADARIFRRELGRLELSVAAADRLDAAGRERIAMLHYPPWIAGREPTSVVSLLRRAGVRVCVYGHLHGEDHALAVRGERDGIRYEFVAADAVGFEPVEIVLPQPRGER